MNSIPVKGSGNVSTMALKNGNAARSVVTERDGTQSESAKEVLANLFSLLEEYAPSWYTQQHHDRAVAALRMS